MTDEEYVNSRSGYVPLNATNSPEGLPSMTVKSDVDLQALAERVDWREKGAVSPVLVLASCGNKHNSYR